VQVRIQDYQTVKDTSLEIRGFTVIVGKSNTGKTALLRAIEGSMFNDPITGRVREGETDTVVTIEYEDLSWTWKKGENFNDYIVTTPKGTEEYSSVGRNVPKEITECGFREWFVDREKTRPQMAAWHQPIFLLNRTGKVVTELMTAVTRLDVVNLAIRNCSSEIRKNRQTIKVRETDLKKAQKHERSFEALADIPAETLNGLWDDHQALAARIKQLDGFIVGYDKAVSAVDALAPIDGVKVPKRMGTKLSNSITQLAGWDAKMGKYAQVLEKLEALDGVTVPDRVEVSTDIDRMDTWVRRLERADSQLESLLPLDTVVVPRADFGGLDGQIIALTGYMRNLGGVLKDIKAVKGEETTVAESLEHDSRHLDQLRGQIDECPVCGRS